MKHIIACILLLLPAHIVAAQQFKWVKTIGNMYGGGQGGGVGGGISLQNEVEHTNNLCTDPNKNLYAANLVLDTALKADTFYDARGHNTSNLSLLLTSYNCDGTMRWARLLEGKGDVKCFGLQYYAGNIYMAGRFGDTGANPNRYIAGVPVTSHDYQHYFLARFDTLGALRWIRFVGANDQSSAIILAYNIWGTDDHSLAIDGQGNIHHIAYLNNGVKVTSSVTAQTGTYDLKYDTAGTLVSAVRLGVDSAYFLYDHVGNTQYNYKNTVCISKKSGKIFTVMYRLNTNSLNPPYIQCYLCAFAPGGALIWQDSLSNGVTGYPARIRDACYDGVNSIYLSGEGIFGQFSLNGTSPAYTPVIAGAALTAIIKVDTNGKPAWIYANEHYGNFFKLGNTTILPNGNILAALCASGVVSHGKDSVKLPNTHCGPFYTIVTPQGNLVKMDGVLYTVGPLSLISQFSAVAVDKVGNIYFGGYQGSDTLKFPGGLINLKFPYPSNNFDAFIAKLGLDCRCTAPAHAGYKDSIVNEKTVYFTYTGTTEIVDSVVWSFGSGQTKKVITGLTTPFSRAYTSYAAYSRDTVCVTVYSACGVDKFCHYPTLLAVVAVQGMEGLRVYPNPAQAGRFSVSLDAGRPIQTLSIVVTSITGQQVYRRQYHSVGSSFFKEIDMHDVAKGVYFLEVVGDGERVVRRVIIQ